MKKDYCRKAEALIQDIESQPAAVQTEFCLLLQSRIEQGISTYGLLEAETLKQLEQTLPENTSFFRWYFEKIETTLAEKTIPALSFLAREFNKLLEKHTDTPKKTVNLYLQASKFTA